MVDHEDMLDSHNTNAEQSKFVCGVVEGFYGRPWSTEQRKDLFAKANKMGLNAYLYAPKDDHKHRMYWRELYSVDEVETMQCLIESAKEQGITFYYAISPGIDITYSSQKELTALKRKLDQVSKMGCNAFALLFDDIEPEMSETDKEVFQSFAHAQVSVSNEIFQHLNSSNFMFCPTEYCASRAVPNVTNSDYLNTIGSKLLPDIDIMWTGPKVISETISLKSIEELTEVFKRPPVIWDNIHANDYDQRRLFLGPYSGRSPDLIPLLRGVMTNPNCEYETNFIALHTLAQWSKCSIDGKRDLSSMTDPVTAEIKLETQSEDGSSAEDIPDQLSPETYHPRQALKIAIREWIAEFQTPKSVNSKIVGTRISGPLVVPADVVTTQVPIVPTCMVITPTTQTNPSSELPIPPISSTDVEIIDSTAVVEPMDCNPMPNLISSSSEIPLSACPNSTEDSTVIKDSEMLEAEEKLLKDSLLSYEDLNLIVDMFYLPYEHGHLGLQIMQEFQWLKANANCMVSKGRKRGSSPTTEMGEWVRRAGKFNEINKTVSHVFSKLTACKNRSLLYDIYPYMWDIKGVVSLLNSYVKWLALGGVCLADINYIYGPSLSWFRKDYKEQFSYAEQESWVFRGGLTGELQRLLPLEGAQDLFVYKPPEQPVNKIFTIRPFMSDDKEQIYNVCLKTSDDGSDGTSLYPQFSGLISDKHIGGMIVLSPEFCFVIEDEDGICGYALAAIDAQQFLKKQEIAWLPEMCSKYPVSDLHSAHEKNAVNGLHNYKSYPLPEVIIKHHPSILRINILPSVNDSSVPKRLLACAMSALKANGSCGVFAEINIGDKRTFESYNRLGFLQVSLPPGSIPDETIYLGRTF